MSLFAKGKVLNQEGDIATIQLSNEELGRAVLSYIVNNADKGIGETFMQSLFSGKPMSIMDLLNSNNKKNKEEEKNIKTNTVRGEFIENKRWIEDASCGYTNSEMIELLKEQRSVRLKVTDLKEKCILIHDKIIKSKNAMNSQVFNECDIELICGDNTVTYNFINNEKGTGDTITPNNNLVFRWDESKTEELEELISLI